MEAGLLHNPVAIFLTIIAITLIAPLFSERVHLPGVVGLIIGGIIVGPFGLRLLGVDQVIELFAEIGLIYLMFSAGLEVDLPMFNRVRNKAIAFGVFTFFVPLIGGALLGLALNLSFPAAILLGSAVSSHTLIAFPLAARLGISSREPVAITVGATVFTDIAAFLVLAIISGMQQGDASIGRFAALIIGLIVYAAIVLFGLPRFGKQFLARFSGGSVEFQFVLVALFAVALAAQSIGLHPVVGAFLAGLAINSMLPHRSMVVGRVLFLGEALFIPVFLIYSGMITDPTAFLAGAETLALGFALTAVAYLTKLIAAWIAARIYGFSFADTMTIWGLSQAQAAVTLPTVIVGVELGLFPQTIFSATMLMILATSITSPLLVQRFGRKLSRAHTTRDRERPNPFARILVPTVDTDKQEHLLELAGILAREKNGIMIPLHVALASTGVVVGLEVGKKVVADEMMEQPDTSTLPLRRVDTHVARGILHSALEQDASIILMGWRGKPNFQESLFGTTLDEVVWHARSPVMAGRLTHPINAMTQVMLLITRDSTAYDFVDEMVEVAAIIAQAINAPLLILPEEHYYELVCKWCVDLKIDHQHEIRVLSGDPLTTIQNQADEHTLIVLATTGSRQRFRSSLGHLPVDLAARTPAALVVLHYPAPSAI